MNSFDLKVKIQDSIPIMSVKGYYDGEAGKKVNRTADDLLGNGNTTLILDFSECELVNSPGVSTLLDLTLKVIDDFRGRLVLCGLDSLKTRVFSMANIFPMAQKAKNMVEALEIAKQKP